MKTCAVIVLSLICSLSLAQLPVQRPSEAEILKAKGDGAKIIIEKAYSILFHAQVFASRAIGEAGAPTSTCWALTVIVKHDPEALKRLAESLSHIKQPEQKLYALTAMFAVDPKTAERWPISSFPASQREGLVHTMDGCIYSGASFEDALIEVYHSGARRYLFDELPSIYQTTDVARHEEK